MDWIQPMAPATILEARLIPVVRPDQTDQAVRAKHPMSFSKYCQNVVMGKQVEDVV